VKLLSRYKGRVEKALRPVIDPLARWGIHPNLLTLVGFLVSILAAAALWRGLLAWGGVLMLASGLFDMLDGALARATGRITRFGAFLDSSVDRYSEIAIYTALIVHFRASSFSFLLLLALAGSFMISYTRARSEGIGQDCRVGMLERTERMILLALGCVLGDATLRVVAVILAVFTHVTAVQRVLHVWRETDRRGV
jgi:CDP-diacylglycerol--glycerol-3-phosphate 3-phosphatidyltransferase